MHITVELFKTKPVCPDLSKVHRIMSVFDRAIPGSIITAVPPRLFPKLGDNFIASAMYQVIYNEMRHFISTHVF